MKILTTNEARCYIVETDADEYPTYYRFGKGSWYNMMGESLEPMWGEQEAEMEAMFQKAIMATWGGK
jgi:hypothetical protein